MNYRYLHHLPARGFNFGAPHNLVWSPVSTLHKDMRQHPGNDAF